VKINHLFFIVSFFVEIKRLDLVVEKMVLEIYGSNCAENTVLSGRTLRIMLPVCSVKMTIYSLNFEIPEMV